MADQPLPNLSDIGDDAVASPKSAMDWIVNQRRAAQSNALTSLDDSPDDAARAQELSRATGVDPALVYGNLDEFQQQHKAAITSSLLTNNQYLRDYANSHPLAAKVSNDDWGQLDAVSQAIEKFKGSRAGQVLRAPQTIAGAAVSGFKEGFGSEPMGQWLPAEEGTNRLAWATLTGLGMPIEAMGRAFSGAIEGVKQGAEQGQIAFGADPNAAERRANELAGMVEAELGGLSGRHPAPEIPHEIISKVQEAGQLAKPYVEAGVEPPVGLHPLTDQVHAEQAKLDMKNLDEVMSESQSSATKERAPELFADFVKQHTDSRISIDAEAVRKLYGDKVPEAGDNLLGWAPGIQDQLALAEAHGGDVEVPLSDWLAKVDPEVAKELHDFIRVRPGGMTLDETKQTHAAEPVEVKQGEISSPEDQLVEDEIRESLADAYMDASPGESIIDTARDSIKDMIAQGETHSPEGAPWARVLEGIEKKKAATQDATVNSRGDIVPRNPAVAAVRQASHTAEPLLGQPAVAKGIIPEKTILGSIDLEGEQKEAATFPAADALKQVDKNQLTGVPRALAEFFEDRLTKMAGDTPTWVVPKETMDQINEVMEHPKGTPGFYHSGWHAIVMAQDVAEGHYGHDIATHLLYHELFHAASVREMEQFPKLKAAVRGLMNETDAWLQANDPEARKVFNYSFKNEHEFWAEMGARGDFQEYLATTPMSAGLKEQIKGVGISGKLNTVWDAIRGIMRNLVSQLTGIKEIPDSILDGVLTLGKEFDAATKQLKGGEGGTAGAEPMDRDLFTKAAAIGMTKDQYARYQDLISRRQAEDLEHQKAQAEKLARQQQTQEWKENFTSTRKEMEESLKGRPDIAADRFLRTGELYGEKAKRVKIDRRALENEDAKGLPSDYLGADGVHPDDMAGLFGYQSGGQLVNGLKRLQQEREVEGLTPQAHFNKLVDAETDRQMRKRFGDLEQNILEEAKDHVISQTQMDLLHEEMLALGTKAGGDLAISKDDIKAWVKDQFDKTPVGNHSTDKYLASAGRAGREAEQALLEEKPGDAFKAKQQQYLSMLLANEAKRLEKQKAQFDKLAKRFSKREVGGVPAEYTNWIHDILLRTGNVVRRSVQDLGEAVGRESQDTLEKFVEAKNRDSRIWEEDENAPNDFQVMPVAPFLYDSGYRKTVDEMATEEFRAVHNSVKTLVKNGQDENKILVRGNKEDLQATVGQMVDQLEKLFGKGKQYAFGHKDEGVGFALRTYRASLLQIESIFNRFDKGDPKGIFKRVISEPIFEGAKNLNTLETKYSKMYRELRFDKEDLKKRVENPIFTDPLSGEKGPMTRGNLLSVLQNVGNPSQLDKLARGYKVEDKGQIMQWLFRNTTKEDWDRAQKLGDIFESAFEESANMYHNLSGVTPEKIDIRPVQTPFGDYKGWYHPVIYDPIRLGSSKKLMGPPVMEDGSYYRAATPSGYTKKRTGYAAPIQLNLDAIPAKLKAMLNDIAMRPPVTETAKVFYDPKFQMAVTKGYGKEIKDLMIPYLKDIAGQKQYKDAAQSAAMRYLEYARQNVTATLIGLNPSTVMKHGPTAAMLSIKEVGAANFFREVWGLLSMNDELGEKNWDFAMKGGMVDEKEWGGSEELQRRHRNWQETLTGAQQDVFGENTLRNTVIKMGATPVAISDLLSAVPTWLASYKDQIRQGEEHGDAVATADRTVRRAHGSSAIAAKPRIMRGGPLAQLATPFYTFFNEMFQRQYEMAWRAKDALGEFNEGNYKEGLKEVPNLAKGLWAYVVFPALVEQMVSPIITGNQSTTEKVASYGLRTIASGLPGIRDMVEAYLGGRDPTVGLYSTSAKMLIDATKDVRKGEVSLNKQHAGVTIKHTLTAFGAMSGLTNAQEGRTAQYVYNYATGQERPRDIGSILRGLWHGTSKEPKR